LRFLFREISSASRAIRAVVARTAELEIAKHALDAVVVNAENAGRRRRVDAFGNTVRLIESGVDCDHDGRSSVPPRRDHFPFSNRACGSSNRRTTPPTLPGGNWVDRPHPAVILGSVFSIMGRVFMRPVVAPFVALDRGTDRNRCRIKPTRISRWTFTPRATGDKTNDREILGRTAFRRAAATHRMSRPPMPHVDVPAVRRFAVRCRNVVAPTTAIMPGCRDGVTKTHAHLRTPALPVAHTGRSTCGAIVGNATWRVKRSPIAAVPKSENRR